ncbi:serine hydrolase [Streptococcus himalayensis]|uniref:Serine hydrolase n=1 Tax=Streptococcus himalayensis TaxID=1888195 RepID=A0A917ECQ9_9STRE|nr:serine hydrolase [Streptococcus himalayensis]GGE24096.1 serine hydrolase [Streptococcus himalayensis]
MRKVLFLLLLPALLTNAIVDSTENDVELTEEEKYEITQTPYGSYFTAIPQNPNVYKETMTFETEDLEKVAGSVKPNLPLAIKELTVNQAGVPLFRLANGQYLPADKQVVYEDLVLSMVDTKQTTLWLQPGFTVYEQARINGVKEVKTDLEAYRPVLVSKFAETPSGTYAYVANKGWISQEFLSETDNRMDKVQEILSKHHNQEQYSIYVKQLETGKTAGIHPDKQMYSASVMKLPLLYYTQEKLNQGEYQLATPLKYIEAVNDYKGAYDTAGSGSISKTADNQEYSIEDLINRIAKESDNAATNILGYYVTNQSEKSYREKINQISGNVWDVEEREASSKMAGNMMEAIYHQNGRIIDILSQTNFDDQRISKDIPVKVSHKIGDADDFRHDVAIVYADSPFILAIFTEHSDYETITKIANDVYGVLK